MARRGGRGSWSCKNRAWRDSLHDNLADSATAEALRAICDLDLSELVSVEPPRTGKLILTIFAGFAQFEREMMLERQREGIAKAKAENRYLGRRPSARLKADEAVELFKAGRTVTQIANASVSDVGASIGHLKPVA